MRLLLLAFSMALFALPASVRAEEGDSPLAPFKKSNMADLHAYKDATIKNFSKLYWALGRLDLANNAYIDNYMLINECDIYQNYIQNEFEWNTIREYAREHIKQSRDNFPLRFEFIQPLRLGEYSFEKQGFTVAPDYKIDGIRRFEIQALDINERPCGFDRDILGYPKGLFVELSRPVFFEILPMSPKDASDYINEKTIEFKKLASQDQKMSKLYKFRDIYIVLKVKFFAAAGDYTSERDDNSFARVMGVLEGIEIYDDLERKRLLFSENYQRDKRSNETSKLKSDNAVNAASAGAAATP